MRKFLGFIVLITALMLAVFAPAMATPPQKPVSGGFVVQGFPCEAGGGFCAAGTATGDIAGDVYIELTERTIDPVTFVQFYSGTITITGKNGTLTGEIVDGTLVPTSLTTVALNSTINFTDGTGFYTNRRGTLAVNGAIDLTTFVEVDSYTGTFGVVPPSQR
jgi:opacity protein-like surface antigen